MTRPSAPPDLRRIGEHALAEVLGAFLALPSQSIDPACERSLAASTGTVAGTVGLAGPRLAGRIRFESPPAFLTHVLRLLAGPRDAASAAGAPLEDVAGELANQVAGRVAAQLTAAGVTCFLSSPDLSRASPPADAPRAGTRSARVEALCAGHRLSLELDLAFAFELEVEAGRRDPTP